MRRARERVSDDATRRLIVSGAEFIEFDPGKARERGMALERLQALIDPDAPKPETGPMHG